MRSHAKRIRLDDFMEWICFKIKSKLQVAEWYTAVMLFLAVPFFYLERLVPLMEGFSLFSLEYYPNVRAFIGNFTFWIIPAVISTQYYFICRHRWGMFLGILGANYWWMTLCTVGWATGLIQEGERHHMLPAVLILGGYLYWRRMRWRKKAYKEKDEKEKNRWTRKDCLIGAAMLLAVSLIHVYPLFPKTENFYFFHSAWFHDVQEFVYFLGLFLSNIIWMVVWFFDRSNKWLYTYIAWPLAMFIFKTVAMVVVETGVSTVASAYLFVLPLTVLLTYILYRIRKSLYISMHYREVKRMMSPGAERKLEWIRRPMIFEKNDGLNRKMRYAAAMLLLAVPLFYLERLVPRVEDFPLFSPGYYTNIQNFFRNFISWGIPAVISTQYYFICRHKWGVFLGILSANYWWMTFCTVGWATGLIQEGERLYMLPAALIWSGYLYGRRTRWRRQAYKEKDEKEKNRWTRKDYLIGAAMLFAVSLMHIYPLFPKTENFYFFHSGWFHNVQDFVYYLGLLSSNIIWMSVWFFDRSNQWLYAYIAWPLAMFVFKTTAMITVETGVSTVANNYLFILPLTVFLTYTLYRIRRRLYMRTYCKEIRRTRPPRLGTKPDQMKYPIVPGKHNSPIARLTPKMWRNLFISFALLFGWFFVRADLSDFIHTQLVLNERVYSEDSDVSMMSDIISNMLFITAFFLWRKVCTSLWMRPYIAMTQAMCCFSLLAHLGVNPYEESGYYMSVLCMIFGLQMWRERQYFLNEALYYERLEQEDHDKQRSVINARENLCMRGYKRRKQKTREDLEKIREDKEKNRNSIFQVALCDKVCLQWREYMAEQYERKYQELLAYDIELSEKYTKEMERFKKLKEKLNRNAFGDW